ncbi:hypothetical protein LD692_21450 [Salmonella enterica]|nr:hypothetical protein [Salmonella enterica]MDK0380304.1 hypothetical protein [Salmonella enterica]HDW6454074.1 hypothetical protein [Salmonella enterica subsp. enterica serovar Typhi]HDW6493662.1 hypothetical protein [Salmonella enterica subsp. enterica serovar Typhi]
MMKKHFNILLEKSLYILAILFLFVIFLLRNIYTNGTVNIMNMFLGTVVFCIPIFCIISQKISMNKNTIFRQLALGYGVVSVSNLFFPAIYVYSYIMMNLFGAVEYHELKNELKLDLLPLLKIYFNIENPQIMNLIIFGMLSLILYLLHRETNKLNKGEVQ